MKPEDFGITNYHWEDGFLNVEGSVDLIRKNLTEIPFKFGVIDGNFHCLHNFLKNLKNSPHTITGDFNCGYNQITSLGDGPCHVGGAYNCDNNQLTSIKGIPHKLEYLRCFSNQITELNIDTQIKNIFASKNKITKIDVNLNEFENLAIWENPLVRIDNLKKANHLFLDKDCLICFKDIEFDFISLGDERFYSLTEYHRKIASKKIKEKIRSEF